MRTRPGCFLRWRTVGLRALELGALYAVAALALWALLLPFRGCP